MHPAPSPPQPGLAHSHTLVESTRTFQLHFGCGRAEAPHSTTTSFRLILQTHPSFQTCPHHCWGSQSPAGRPAAQTVCATPALTQLMPADEGGTALRLPGDNLPRCSAAPQANLWFYSVLIFIRRHLLKQKNLSSSLEAAQLHIRKFRRGISQSHTCQANISYGVYEIIPKMYTKGSL